MIITEYLYRKKWVRVDIERITFVLKQIAIKKSRAILLINKDIIVGFFEFSELYFLSIYYE